MGPSGFFWVLGLFINKKRITLGIKIVPLGFFISSPQAQSIRFNRDVMYATDADTEADADTIA